MSKPTQSAKAKKILATETYYVVILFLKKGLYNKLDGVVCGNETAVFTSNKTSNVQI